VTYWRVEKLNKLNVSLFFMVDLGYTIDQARKYADGIWDHGRRLDDSVQFGELNPRDSVFNKALRAAAEADDADTFRRIVNGGMKYAYRVLIDKEEGNAKAYMALHCFRLDDISSGEFDLERLESGMDIEQIDSESCGAYEMFYRIFGEEDVGEE